MEIGDRVRNLEHQELGFAVSNRISVSINPPLASYTPGLALAPARFPINQDLIKMAHGVKGRVLVVSLALSID